MGHHRRLTRRECTTTRPPTRDHEPTQPAQHHEHAQATNTRSVQRHEHRYFSAVLAGGRHTGRGRPGRGHIDSHVSSTALHACVGNGVVPDALDRVWRTDIDDVQPSTRDLRGAQAPASSVAWTVRPRDRHHRDGAFGSARAEISRRRRTRVCSAAWLGATTHARSKPRRMKARSRRFRQGMVETLMAVFAIDCRVESK